MHKSATPIVPRKRGGDKRFARSRQKEIFAPPVLPAPEAPIGLGIAYSDAAERRIRALRRRTLVAVLDPDPVALRPHANRTFVHTRRVTSDGDTHADHVTSDTSCNCEAARFRATPCLHRRALQSVGGTAGFYAHLALALANPALRVCAVCGLLLDGHADDLAASLCADCERKS